MFGKCCVDLIFGALPLVTWQAAAPSGGAPSWVKARPAEEEEVAQAPSAGAGAGVDAGGEDPASPTKTDVSAKRRVSRAKHCLCIIVAMAVLCALNMLCVPSVFQCLVVGVASACFSHCYVPSRSL